MIQLRYLSKFEGQVTIFIEGLYLNVKDMLHDSLMVYI